MNTLSLPGACLCLATGALLGGAFLALKLARLLLRGGRIFLFVSDLLLGPLCAVVAFTVDGCGCFRWFSRDWALGGQSAPWIRLSTAQLHGCGK